MRSPVPRNKEQEAVTQPLTRLDQRRHLHRGQLRATTSPSRTAVADSTSDAISKNMNELLRQYFPRSMDLRTATVDDLHRVEHLLNNRPRKNLGWSTPAAAFAALLRS
jgi:hypothetical protein